MSLKPIRNGDSSIDSNAKRKRLDLSSGEEWPERLSGWLRRKSSRYGAIERRVVGSTRSLGRIPSVACDKSEGGKEAEATR